MPDLRVHQRIAERLDIEIARQPNRMLRRRRWATVLGGLAPLVLLSFFAVRGDRTIYWSAPVSSSHATIANDCQACHRAPWRPLLRFDPRFADTHSVRDHDCRECHFESQQDHSALAVAAQVPACVVCHAEHRGAEVRLAEVGDAHCVVCHADLQTSPAETGRFARRIGSLAEHPEFAVLREQVVDSTLLKFSHRQHLAPLLAPPASTGTEGVTSPRVQLQCGDCHQMAEDGRYMQPITYERHCAECHPLRFSTKIGAEPLPHDTVEIVRAVLRDRLMEYAEAHPEEVSGPANRAESRLPNPSRRAAPTARDTWDWVEAQLPALQTDVFRNPIRNGCEQCHFVERFAHDGAVSTEPAVDSASGPRGVAAGFRILPPRIPARWLHHGRFRHDRHQQMDCVGCHHTVTGDEANRGDAVSVSRGPLTLDSQQTSDVLLPSIHICRQCHGDVSSFFVQGRASGACIECHDYHHASDTGLTPHPSTTQAHRVREPRPSGSGQGKRAAASRGATNGREAGG